MLLTESPNDRCVWIIKDSRHIVSAAGDLAIHVQNVQPGAVVTLNPIDEDHVGQKWVFDGQYIQSAMDASLVITVSGGRLILERRGQVHLIFCIHC